MKLLTYKSGLVEYTYYLDKDGEEVMHGEQKIWHDLGKLWINAFIYHGEWHGEYKCWWINGEIRYHVFNIDGREHPHVEMNEQEKLLFQIKYPGFRFIEE